MLKLAVRVVENEVTTLVKTSFGLLSVTLPYCYSRGPSIYYQRAVPGDLQERYGAKRIKIKLATSDIQVAAREIAALNKRVEAEWAALRAGPDATPKSVREQAAAILGQWGLAPGSRGADEDAEGLFYDHLDRKRERFAEGDEERYREAEGSEYLNAAEIEAARMLAGVSKPRLSDALDLYLEVHPKRGNTKFTTFSKRSFGKLVAAVGDKAIENVERADGHAFVSKMQAEGYASGSIRRDLNVIRSVMETYFLEKKVSRKNPFSSIPIPEEGEDADKAEPYSSVELSSLVQACNAADDQPRWLLAMVADTGARLAEVAGLALDDIDLEAETPHIAIKPHSWRSLKNKGSARVVPLVGQALWAAKRVKQTAAKDQRFAFPRYTTKEKTNSGSASATLNKWIKTTVKVKHTVHELRHTMADRLRDVQCPQDIRHSIGGWALRGVGEHYGKGYGLRVMAEWLRKVAL